MKKSFILLLFAAIFSVASYSQTYHYDVNGDGVVTAADVTALYNYMLGNVPSGDEHEYIDLGLPSGTLWATMNIGANSPEEYGDYFAWGETHPKYNYNEMTYKWCKYNINNDGYRLTKYCTNSDSGYNGFVDNKTELDPEDDAATTNWGSDWCMPSKEQVQELENYCITQWTTRNGVNGRLFTSNINGASLFLPAAGYRRDVDLYDTSSWGRYWSRTLSTTYNPFTTFSLNFSSGGVGGYSCDREEGFSVRPVRVSQ